MKGSQQGRGLLAFCLAGDFIRTHELATYVDMKLGKISGEEYRDIVLREDAD